MKFLINVGEFSTEVRLNIITETSNESLINYAMNSTDSEEKGAVALNANITAADLHKLSKDLSEHVKKCVLRNPKTEGDTIDAMLTDSDMTPNENLIVNHKNVLKKTLERFLATHVDKNLRIVAEKRLRYM